jgi:hypothetical protein
VTQLREEIEDEEEDDDRERERESIELKCSRYSL